MPPAVSEAMQKPPSDLCMRIIRYREQHKLKVLNDLIVYVKLFEDSLELLSTSIDSLNFVDKAGWKSHQGFELAFLSTLPKTLYSAFDQIMSGDYSEGMATSRIAYETLLRICFLEAYPDCHDATILSKKGETNFQAANFLKDNLKVIDKDPFYEFLSYPVHSHKFNVVKAIVEGHKQGGMPISQGFEYVEKELHLSFNYLIGITYIAVRTMAHLFNVHLMKTGHDIKEHTALDNLIQDMPNKFKSLPQLMDKIFMELAKRKCVHNNKPVHSDAPKNGA